MNATREIIVQGGSQLAFQRAEPQKLAPVLTGAEPVVLGVEIGMSQTRIAQIGPKGVLKGKIKTIETPGNAEDLLSLVGRATHHILGDRRPNVVGVSVPQLSADGSQVLSRHRSLEMGGLTSATSLTTDVSNATGLNDSQACIVFDRVSSGAVGELANQRHIVPRVMGDGLFVDRYRYAIGAAAWRENGLVVPYGSEIDEVDYNGAVAQVLSQYQQQPDFDINQIRVTHPYQVALHGAVKGLRAALAVASGGESPSVQSATYREDFAIVGAALGAVELSEGRDVTVLHKGLTDSSGGK